MNDILTQLAEANPVHEHDLTPLDVPTRFARRVPSRRLSASLATAVVAAGALVGVFAFNGSNSGHGFNLGQGSGHHREGVQGEGPFRGTGGTGPTGLIGPTGVNGPTGISGGPRPPRPINRDGHDVSFRFNRTGGALNSVDLSVSVYPKRDFKIEVRYLGPRGDYLQGGYPVVYRADISASSLSPGTGGVGPSGRMGPGGRVSWDWSGKLFPRDWSGGCKSGDYEIDWDFGSSRDFRVDTSTDTFSCRGN